MTVLTNIINDPSTVPSKLNLELILVTDNHISHRAMVNIIDNKYYQTLLSSI